MQFFIVFHNNSQLKCLLQVIGDMADHERISDRY